MTDPVLTIPGRLIEGFCDGGRRQSRRHAMKIGGLALGGLSMSRILAAEATGARSTAVSGGLGQTMGTSQFRMEHLKSQRVEAEVAFDNKVVAADLGVFMATAVA